MLWSLGMWGVPAPPQLPPAPFGVWPRAVQRRLTVYGSLGGSAIGAFAWLVIQAVRAGDWITALVTALFGVGVVVFLGRVLMRRPERRLQVLMWALALFGLFTLVTCGWHWRDWTKAAGVQTTALEGMLVGAGLTFVAVFLAGFLWFRRRWTRSGNRRQP